MFQIFPNLLLELSFKEDLYKDFDWKTGLYEDIVPTLDKTGECHITKLDKQHLIIIDLDDEIFVSRVELTNDFKCCGKNVYSC